MSMKRKNSRKLGLVLGAAASTAAMSMVSNTFGAVSITITNLGTPSDTYYNGPSVTTYTGYTAYAIGLTADTGDTVDNITAGGSVATTADGFFGPLIQDWEAVTNRSGPTGSYNSTPQLSTQNGSSGGPALDSHFVIAPTLTINAPNEDNNGVTPSGVATNGGYDLTGTGTFLQGNFSFTAASSVTLAYIVLKNGTTANYNIVAAEGPTGLAATVLTPFQGSIGAPAASTNQPIISLTSVAPTSYGSQLGTAITITGKNGSYKYGTTGAVLGQTTAYTSVATFNPTNDTEVYALKLSSNGSSIASTNTTMIAAIIGDINTAATGNTGNITASTITGAFANQFPGYDILLTSTGFTATTGTAYLGVDFSHDTDPLTPALTVTQIAAVPEPTTAIGVVFGAAGLLLGRRKSRVLVS